MILHARTAVRGPQMPGWRRSRRSVSSVAAGSKKKGKKKPEYGSGRANMSVDYLHFGRLIGETAEETAQKFQRPEGAAEDDEKEEVQEGDRRAMLYLKKWNQEEELSYSMFETLLDGNTSPRERRMKDLTFEAIMSGEDAEMQEAYETLVLSSVDDNVPVESSSEPKRNTVREILYEILHELDVQITGSRRRLEMVVSAMCSREKSFASRSLPSAP